MYLSGLVLRRVANPSVFATVTKYITDISITYVHHNDLTRRVKRRVVIPHLSQLVVHLIGTVGQAWSSHWTQQPSIMVPKLQAATNTPAQPAGHTAYSQCQQCFLDKPAKI
jgi:hypothetical protein